MRQALGTVLLVLLAGCGETVDGDPTPVAVCPDGSDPGELVDGAELAVGGCVLLGGYDTPTQRFTAAASSDEGVLAPDGVDPRLFSGGAAGDVVVTVQSYSADCSDGQACATENEDDELRVTLTG